MKTEKKLSFAEAKKEVQKTCFVPSMSYSSVVKKTVSTSSCEAQVGEGIPPGMLLQLRKEYPNVNRPSLLSGKVDTSTQARPGSSASAPAPQAAGAKQTIQSARQGPKPAPNPKPPTLTPTPARQEVRVDVQKPHSSAPAPQAAEAKQAPKSAVQATKPGSSTRPSSQQEARVDKYRSNKYQPKAPTRGSSSQRSSPDRLKKAERDLVHANFFDCLSDNSVEITSGGEEMDHLNG